MSGKFTHYLVTRFNVNIRGNGPEYIASETHNAKWVEERLPLFDSICVPSVLGQTCRDFTWLIYCDKDTTDEVIQHILTVTQKIQFVEIHLVESFDQLVQHLQTRCSESPTSYIITSRLDNDDAIGRHYIETIQSNFSAQPDYVLNLLGGINYHISKKLMTYLRHKEHNHFISLIEQNWEDIPLTTIMGFSHLHPPGHVPVKNVGLKYAFWITLHSQNAAPRNNRGWPVFQSQIAKHYSIDPSHTPISWLNTILYTIGWLPEALYRKLRFIAQQRVKQNANRG